MKNEKKNNDIFNLNGKNLDKKGFIKEEIKKKIKLWQ